MQALITAAVTEPLEALVDALQEFKRACLQPGAVLRGQLFNPMDGMPNADGNPTELLIEAIGNWDIATEALNGSVNRYPGVFEVEESVMSAAQRLNESKLVFAGAVKSLEADGIDPRSIRTAYRSAGLPRLHPLQAWREVFLLQGTDLASVGFTVVKGGHSIEVMPVEEARERLLKANAMDVLEQLRGIPEGQAIHWHTPVSRHIKANVVWQGESGRATRMYNASLPFLVCKGFWPTKRVRFNQPRSHAPRKDTKGTSIAYLPMREGAFLSTN